MAISIKSALENIKEIYVSDSSLTTLMDIERVVNSLDIYAFKHWKLGELVEGPIYEKYFVTTTWMWPYKKMPDPRGGEQLLNYKCEVLYKKDKLEYPVKPKSSDDFKPGTKVAKTKKVPIWLVTLTIPKSLLTDIEKGSIEVENEKVDMEELNKSYEADDLDDTTQDTETTDDQETAANFDNPMGGEDEQPPM